MSATGPIPLTVFYSRLEIWAPTDSLFWAGMNLRRNSRSGRHFLPEADVEKYYTGGRPGRLAAAGTAAGRAPRRGRAGDGQGAAARRGPGARGGAHGGGPGSTPRPRGAGSGPPRRERARRPGPRCRRLSLLPPRALLPRGLLLAGSPPPPPPQPRLFSGFSSPSRPGRPAGTILESEGLSPSPAAVGGHL